MSINSKAATAMLLLSTIAFSCSKKTVTPDPADQFVGTYTGTSKLYIAGGALVSTTNVTGYTITKLAEDEIAINAAGATANGFVTGSSFNCSYNATITNIPVSVDEAGVLSGTTLTETGTAKSTDPSTGIVINYTFNTVLNKQ